MSIILEWKLNEIKTFTGSKGDVTFKPGLNEISKEMYDSLNIKGDYFERFLKVVEAKEESKKEKTKKEVDLEWKK